MKTFAIIVILLLILQIWGAFLYDLVIQPLLDLLGKDHD